MRYWRKLKRALAYFLRGWKSPDYNRDYLYKDMLFKMQRMMVQFNTERGSVFAADEKEFKRDQTIKSLRIAIKLLDKMVRPWKHYRKNMLEFEKTYGEVTLERTGEEVIRGETLIKVDLMINGKPLRDNPELQAKNREAHARDDRHEERDRKLFFKIFEKYSRYWWS